MTAYSTVLRALEVGIRKTLGAKPGNIIASGRDALLIPAVENYPQRVQVDAECLTVPFFHRSVRHHKIDIIDGALQQFAFALPLRTSHGLAKLAQILYRRVETTALLLIELVAMDQIFQILIGSLHSIANSFL